MFLTVWAKHWVTSAHTTLPLKSGTLNFSWVSLKLNTQKGLGSLQVLHILKLLMTWYLQTGESLLNFFLKHLSYPENESHILDSWAIGNVEALWKTLPAGNNEYDFGAFLVVWWWHPGTFGHLWKRRGWINMVLKVHSSPCSGSSASKESRGPKNSWEGYGYNFWGIREGTLPTGYL